MSFEGIGSGPDFKTYIFGMILQFPTIWLKKMIGIFFNFSGLQDPSDYYIKNSIIMHNSQLCK